MGHALPDSAPRKGSPLLVEVRRVLIPRRRFLVRASVVQDVVVPHPLVEREQNGPGRGLDDSTLWVVT